MVNYINEQVQADLMEITRQNIPWHQLENTTVLITGATGMLASYVGFVLLFLNKKLRLNIQPVFLARSQRKLEMSYGEELYQAHCLVQDVCETISYKGNVDYIFHAAGAASPYYIINDPLGIIKANVLGTKNVLEFACAANCKNITFASTREIYGKVEGKTFINEDDMGTIDPLQHRACYPESKRLAEALFMAYYHQHGINFNTIRIAHSYGPGMQITSDGRVMADLLNDVVNGRDIVLKSNGEAERAFCYVTDAVSGIFRVMLEGEPSLAYNLANEKEPILIRELARLIQALSGNRKGVRFDLDHSQRGYTDYVRTSLDTKRIESIGWDIKVSLEDGIKRTLCSILDHKG